jgi:hypothetical protein
MSQRLIFEQTTKPMKVGEFSLPGSVMTITQSDEPDGSFLISETCDGKTRTLLVTAMAVKAMAGNLTN